MPIITAVLIILLTSLNFAYATTAKVIKIYDGDTLKVDVQGEALNIRLYGVSAPEGGQDGNVAATRFLRRLILGHPLEIQVMETDLFGRPLAIVIREGKESSVNAAVVANGYAWVNPGECKSDPCNYWKKLELSARKLKLGIWSGYDLVPPWEFGKQKR